MNWKKRDCPIAIKLVPYGAGREDFIIDINGDHHYYAVSGVLGGGFGALMESLYALYPNQHYCFNEDRHLRDSLVEEHKCAVFWWEEEGGGVQWTLTQSESCAKTFLVYIKLEEKEDATDDAKIVNTFTYSVSYSDLC